ncbi:TOBE domain-containing protein [Hydrogenimonas sp.]
MNRIPARIVNIQVYEGISCVTFDAFGESLTMISLELPQGIKREKEVVLGVKSTHIALCSHRLPNAAISNQIPMTIEKITKGNILVSLTLLFEDITVESVVPKAALANLSFAPGDTAIALFQASELSILKVL